MDLFLETPQQAADRERRRMRAQAWSADGAPLPELFRPQPVLDGAGCDKCPDATGGDPGAVRSQTAADTAQVPVHEAYRAEIAFDRQRTRRRLLTNVARIALMVLLFPLLLAAVFLASYTLTLVVNGASPDEVMQQITSLAARFEGFIDTVAAMVW